MRTDADIRKDILAELSWDPQIDRARIDVAVQDSAVTLTGTARSYTARRAAERAAQRVKGVRAVAEDIRVELSAEHVEDDGELARRIAHMLAWDHAVPHDRIVAEVRNGMVTLNGSVPWRFQRDIVEQHVERLRGVRGVVNLLKVDQPVSGQVVKSEIVRALHRHADMEASHISVEVEGGKVVLNGAVRAWFERELAEKAAWSAPGVTAVEDNLRLA